MARGWWTAYRWRGIAFRLHWSLPVVAFFVGTGYLARSLAFVALLAAHEVGHAILVRRFGGTVLSIELTGLVGFCRWQGSVRRHDAALIAWGGILAQCTLLAVGMFAVQLFPDVHRIRETKVVLVDFNIGMMVLNLIPIPPLDGALAWSALAGMFRRAPRETKRQRAEYLRVIGAPDDDEDDRPPSVH